MSLEQVVSRGKLVKYLKSLDLVRYNYCIEPQCVTLPLLLFQRLVYLLQKFGLNMGFLYYYNGDKGVYSRELEREMRRALILDELNGCDIMPQEKAILDRLNKYLNKLKEHGVDSDLWITTSLLHGKTMGDLLSYKPNTNMNEIIKVIMLCQTYGIIPEKELKEVCQE